ncbi:hypothetical protein ACHWGW_33065, partial [Klebsiella pneumoniae]
PGFQSCPFPILVAWPLINFPGARANFMDGVEGGERYPFPPVSINGERA